MIEVIKQFFGNSVSAVEAWVAGVGLGGIFLFLLGVWKTTHTCKKLNKSNEETQKAVKKEINDFKEQTKEENEQFKAEMKKNVNNLADMLLIEATKEGVNIEKFKEIVSIYKATAIEFLDTETLIENKEKEEEQAQTTQEQVNENLNNIDNLMNDLV